MRLVVNEFFSAAFVVAGQDLTYVNTFKHLRHVTDNVWIFIIMVRFKE